MLFADLFNIDEYDDYAVVMDGKLVLYGTSQPETDLARLLQEHGLSGNLTLLDGRTGIPRSVINIAAAAKVIAEERPEGLRFRKWRGKRGVAERATDLNTTLEEV